MDRLDELRQRQDELLLRKKGMEELLDSSGWKLIDAELSAAQRAYRQEDFANGLNSIDSAFQSAGVRGMIDGITRARLKPQQILDDIAFDLAGITAELEEAHRDRES